MSKVTAEEARRLNQEYIDKQVQLAYTKGMLDDKIKKAASKGMTSFQMSILKYTKDIKEPLFKLIKDEYQNKGFEVNRHVGYDEYTDWDDIVISW